MKGSEMTDELKPVRCGCGGEAWRGIVYVEGIRFFRVYCENCRTETDIYDTEAEAVTAWNRAMGNRDELSRVERTAKVDIIAGRPFCPNCGDELEWE